MLTYAFECLKEDKYKYCGSEDFKDAGDLFAEILNVAISKEIKRGLNKDYILYKSSLKNPVGKFNLTETIKTSSIPKKQIVCEYDVFSCNSYLNKIIKTTINLLIRSDIGKERKKKLRKLIVYLNDVDELDPYTINWEIQFNKNNQTYKMIIYICWLVVKGLLQTTNEEKFKLNGFIDEKRMCELYEKFILKYYKKEFKNLTVSHSQIKWALDDENDFMLPIMQSDVMIDSKDKTLIIDAKYYTKMVQKRFDSEKIHSFNLYQIYTYVKNENKIGKQVSGLLLYAQTDGRLVLDNSYLIDGNKISVKSLDLNCEFEEIKNQLNHILVENGMI